MVFKRRQKATDRTQREEEEEERAARTGPLYFTHQ